MGAPEEKVTHLVLRLERKLAAEYPQVNWLIKKTNGIDPVRMSEEETKTVDAAILGVCW